MQKWIGGIIDRLCVVSGALLFSQIPQFIQQYSQRLAGHVAELKIQTTALAEAAQFSGKTIDQLIAKFLSSGDLDFVHQGEFMQQTLVRFHQLSAALYNLSTSSALARPIVFFSQIDRHIAEGTLQDFVFGISLTIEGGVYALVGMIAGTLFYHVLVFSGKAVKSLFQTISLNKTT